jgi:hypothetical protein
MEFLLDILFRILFFAVFFILVGFIGIFRMNIYHDEHYKLDDYGIKYGWDGGCLGWGGTPSSSKLEVSILNRFRYVYRDTKYTYFNKKERR